MEDYRRLSEEDLEIRLPLPVDTLHHLGCRNLQVGSGGHLRLYSPLWRHADCHCHLPLETHPQLVAEGSQPLEVD